MNDPNKILANWIQHSVFVTPDQTIPVWYLFNLNKNICAEILQLFHFSGPFGKTVEIVYRWRLEEDERPQRGGESSSLDEAKENVEKLLLGEGYRLLDERLKVLL